MFGKKSAKDVVVRVFVSSPSEQGKLPKLCSNCAWYRPHCSLPLHAKCAYPPLCTVDGVSPQHYCEILRNNEQQCGYDARWFSELINCDNESP